MRRMVLPTTSLTGMTTPLPTPTHSTLTGILSSEGNGGQFALADPMATISAIDANDDGVDDATDNIVRFEETGANTGVFDQPE